MEKQILQSVDPDDRIRQLKDSADKVEMFTYSRELEVGELQELQSDLSQSLIKIDQEDQKLKMARETYKAVVKPLRETMKSHLQKVRTGTEEVNEDVYLLKDMQEMKVGYYSKDGKLVFERGLRPDEMQFSIQEHLKKVN